MPVRLALYDLHGREVATLLEYALPGGGEQTIDFDAARYPALRSGEYICRLQHGATSVTKRMVVVR